MPNQPFPRKTALAIATAVTILTAVRLFMPTKGLNPDVLFDAAYVNLVRHDPSHVPGFPTRKEVEDTLHPQKPGNQETVAGPDGTETFEGCPVSPIVPGTGVLPHRQTPISLYLFDPCRNLQGVMTILRHLEKGITSDGLGHPLTATILHYGDSPTTADLITGDVRDLLQQRFGNAGTGFILPGKPWAWYQHRGVDLADSGWTISNAVGKGREEVYGLGGASFEGGPGASTRLTLKEPTVQGATIEIAFLYRPNAGSLSVSANGNTLETFSTALEPASSGPATPRLNWHTITLPPGTRTIELKPVGAAVRLFGLNLLTGRPGVVYDSLGLNGASTSVLSTGFNAASWSAALKHTSPTLVIINYGTNESSYGPYVDKLYEGTLRTAIARIRAALPGVPILVMSPMDRGRRAGVDQIETYDTIPRIIAIQRRVAAELNCAFFDTFDAMGGDGTMARWYSGHPRLVAGDLIHPTPQGASIVAHLFVHDLSLAYDRYLGHQPTPDASKKMSSFAEGSAADSGGGPASLAGTPAPAIAKPHPSLPTPKPKPSAAGEPAPAPPTNPTPEPIQPPPS